jgi:hypothetical protein
LASEIVLHAPACGANTVAAEGNNDAPIVLLDPFDGEGFSVAGGGGPFTAFRVYDLSGALVASGELDLSQRASIPQLPHACYVLELSNAGGARRVRFVR